MSTHKPRLALGTVQFGLSYGISNRSGLPSLSTVVGILAEAERAGIDLLDTSNSYGESEERLGALLSSDHRFSIVTKTPTFRSSTIGLTEEADLRAAFTGSLSKLRQGRVYGLLVHHAKDLLAPGGERLMNVMSELQSLGLVQKVGVSIYSKDQLSQIMAQYDIDIVQVPMNIFDQRLLQDDILGQLKRRGVEIHARSAFLQGLLLMNPDEIPPYLSELRPKLDGFRRLCDQADTSPLAGALAFMRHLPVDRVVVGVTSPEELAQVTSAWNEKDGFGGDYSRFAVSDEDLIDPSRWPTR